MEKQIQQRLKLIKSISRTYSPESIKMIIQAIVDMPPEERETKAEEMRKVIEECDMEQDAIKALRLGEEE